MIKRGDKKAQFYFMATIIIVALLISIVVTINYSLKTKSYEAEEIAKDLTIETEKVLDYDTLHSTNELDNFAKVYSRYVGQDKEIYFIFVDNDGSSEAFRYVGENKVDFTSSLAVDGNEIQFIMDNNTYKFNLKEGKNLYFLLIYESKGEKYVFSG